MRRLRLAASLVGGAAGAALAARPSLMPWPAGMRVAVPATVGLAAAAAAALLTGGLPRPRTVLVGAAGVSTAGAAGVVVGRRVLAGMVRSGQTLDPGFADPPQDELVTGGPGSLVEWSTVGREGARFVHSRASSEDAAKVLGRPSEKRPIRVYVGVSSAPTVEARVELAMAELRRTGAFDRAYLMVQAPAGTGYANPTPVQVVEVLTAGDCASVAVGYGLIPSFLSLGKVGIAALTQRSLLEAIRRELADRAHAPKILLYGESLGARVQEAGLLDPERDLDAFCVEHALWVGTPGGQASDALHAALGRQSIRIDRPAQIPADLDRRPRVWFLEHDGDPVTRNRPRLLLHRPDWLAPGVPRGRNVPESMRWVPLVTWLQVLVDTFFATNVKPGEFMSRGHDYRADLGATVAAAFGLAATSDVAARLEAFLRAAEVSRAARISAP